MASKSSSPGPSVTAATATKAARSRKAAATKQDNEANVGRAGSAGGVVLGKETKSKDTTTNATTTTKPATTDATTETATNRTKRKPRKLNKDPTRSTPAPASADSTPTDVAAAAELEALKSRVRGLEAKVEELYKTGPTTQTSSNRSPRRRGKGRKGSSTQQVPTLSSTTNATKPPVNDDERVVEVDDAEESADEELTRLESELAIAKQDLQRYRPRTRRNRSGQTNTTYLDDDDVEEIPRDLQAPGIETTAAGTRQVTLSGSYRIPLPASVNTEDLKTIQNGVSAAQNLARGFLEQRRATQQTAAPPSTTTTSAAQSTSTTTNNKKTTSASTAAPRPKPRQVKSMSSNMEIIPADDGSGKQSWSEWIGGYSMAISRAVKNIEHEAMVESQIAGAAARKPATGGTKKTGGGSGNGIGAKRQAAKAKMGGEGV